ncbi:MAG: cytochrome c peroxidase [Gammaproteobacteria bacterium]|nr:c-type cytochrome [Pseudomonadales bacterium]MCP5349223.1 c-type cytochrome [Pseudomonadales bacterium]
MRLRIVAALSLGVLALNSQADETAEQAYRDFLQARGEPAWIGAGAEHPAANSVIRPTPALATFDLDPDKQALGFDLYHEARLSRDGTVSCASCHMGMMGGTDRQTVSRGIGGAIGSRNAPTVFNSAFNFRQFWDGRALDLDEQALGPISNPVEMGHDLDAVLQWLAADPYYAGRFATIYPDGVTAANLGNAIATHVRTMTRNDSRFNRYLTSGEPVLSEQELRGWQRFNDLGCAACHNGINLGGNSYQKLASARVFDDQLVPGVRDEGLFGRTGREQDRQVFKVPSLQNITRTAPYFHDGSVRSLEEAVRLMGRLNAGRELSDADVGDLVVFLGSLDSQSMGGMGGMGGMEGMGGMQHDMSGAGSPGGMHQHMQHMQQMMQMNHGQHHGNQEGF